MFSKGHNGTFNRFFFFKGQMNKQNSPFTTQMESVKNELLIKNAASEEANQETCFSLSGLQLLLVFKIIWSPGGQDQ